MHKRKLLLANAICWGMKTAVSHPPSLRMPPCDQPVCVLSVRHIANMACQPDFCEGAEAQETGETLRIHQVLPDQHL